MMAQNISLEPWQDPEMNEVNRMAAHADFVNKNEWRMSLHGIWNNATSDGPRTMPIPSMWELTKQREQNQACLDSAESRRKKAEGQLNGYGEPMYAGQNYEWKTWWKSNPPALPDSLRKKTLKK